MPGLKVITQTRVGGVELGHILKFILTTPVQVNVLSAAHIHLHMHDCMRLMQRTSSCRASAAFADWPCSMCCIIGDQICTASDHWLLSVQFIVGWPIHRGAARSLRHGSANMCASASCLSICFIFCMNSRRYCKDPYCLELRHDTSVHWQHQAAVTLLPCRAVTALM